MACGQNLTKWDPGSVQVCDYIFRRVKKLRRLEIYCFSEGSRGAKVEFLLERCYKNKSLARLNIQCLKNRFGKHFGPILGSHDYAE